MYNDRPQREFEKRRANTRSSVVKAWLEAVVKRCGKGPNAADDFKDNLKLITFELVHNYAETVFTANSARAIADKFPGGFPDSDKLREALDAYQKQSDTTVTSRGVSEFRMRDPRVRKLELADRMWVARWDARTQEFSIEGDPLFDDVTTISRSKKGNLASLIHANSRAAWSIISNPVDEYNLPLPKPRTIELIEEVLGFAPVVVHRVRPEPRNDGYDEINF